MGTKTVTLALQLKKHQQLFQSLFWSCGGCKDLVNLVKGGSKWEGSGSTQWAQAVLLCVLPMEKGWRVWVEEGLVDLNIFK